MVLISAVAFGFVDWLASFWEMQSDPLPLFVCLFFFNSAPILNEILLPSSLIVWIESHQVGHDTHTNETCSVQPIEILSRNHSEHVLSCKWRKILGGNRHRSENQRRLNVLNGNSVFFCFIAIKMKKKTWTDSLHYGNRHSSTDRC